MWFVQSDTVWQKIVANVDLDFILHCFFSILLQVNLYFVFDHFTNRFVPNRQPDKIYICLNSIKCLCPFFHNDSYILDIYRYV